jgi:hypothetical protein
MSSITSSIPLASLVNLSTLNLTRNAASSPTDTSSNFVPDPNLTYDFDVIILGSGPSGLSAAHELALQNLRVAVFEKDSFIGGKPISYFLKPYAVIQADEDPTAFLNSKETLLLNTTLPSEHSFRVYPNNYQNLRKILNEIPHPEGGIVSDRLTNVLHLAPFLDKNKAPMNLNPLNNIKAKLEVALIGAALYFPYLIDSERSLEIYDAISFRDQTAHDLRSPEMRTFLDRIAGSTSSGNPRSMSSIAVTNLLLNYYNAPNGTGLQTFNQPTHLAWLEPWRIFLESKGVKFFVNSEFTSFNFSNVYTDQNPDITSVNISASTNLNALTKAYSAKYFISAIPPDNLQEIIDNNLEMVRYDPNLFSIKRITTLPATGVQLFYETRINALQTDILSASLLKHPWELSILNQTGYWSNPQRFAGNYGIITIYTAVLNEAGLIIKKPILKCTPNEIAIEMFTYVESIYKDYGIILPRRTGYSCHNFVSDTLLDGESGARHMLHKARDERLHLSIPDMYKMRPKSNIFMINNMVLAGAYTQNKTYYVSTMESASESGRRAANTILPKLGKSPITVYEEIPLPFYITIPRKIDKVLYRFGLPSPFVLLYNCLKRRLDNRNTHMDALANSFINLNRNARV